MDINSSPVHKVKKYDEEIRKSPGCIKKVVTEVELKKKPPDPKSMVHDMGVNIISCQKCYRVFKNKNRLNLHQKSCLKINKCESFLKYEIKKSYTLFFIRNRFIRN